MIRHTGLRVSMMQWSYKHKKLVEVLGRLDRSAEQLRQLMKNKQEKNKKNSK